MGRVNVEYLIAITVVLALLVSGKNAPSTGNSKTSIPVVSAPASPKPKSNSSSSGTVTPKNITNVNNETTKNISSSNRQITLAASPSKEKNSSLTFVPPSASIPKFNENSVNSSLKSITSKGGPYCRADGKPCNSTDDCCSQTCYFGRCGLCKWSGKCTSNSDCCLQSCRDGKCSSCKWWGKCKKAHDCCSRNCVDKYCVLIPPPIKPTTTPKPCYADGHSCSDPSDCCSLHCDKVCLKSAPTTQPPPTCGSDGDDCKKNADCCKALYCVPYFYYRYEIAHHCKSQCIPEGSMCDANEQCCPGAKCVDKLCVSNTCAEEEEYCTKDKDCCEGPCQDNQCLRCAAAGEYCHKTSECCHQLSCAAYSCHKPGHVDNTHVAHTFEDMIIRE